MAISATFVNDAIVAYGNQNLDLYEHRLSNYGLLEAAKIGINNMLPALKIEEIKKAEGHTTKVPVINNQTFTVTTSRSLTIADSENTSAFVTLTFATLRSAFSLITSQYKSNYIAKVDDMGKKMWDMQKTWLAYLDNLAYTKVNTDKAQTLGDAAGNPYSLDASNDIVVPYADRENFFAELKAILMANNLTPEDMLVVGSPRMLSVLSKIQESGLYNAENKAMRLLGTDFGFSNKIVNDAGQMFTGFALKKDSFGMINWNDIDAQMKNKANNGEAYTQILPLLGMEVGVFYANEFADKSAVLAGLQRTQVDYFEFSTDVAWITSYNSAPTTVANPIFKFKVANS